MKPIKKEDMKVGDLVYIKYKEKPRERRFIVKINNLNINNKGNSKVEWWRLKNILKGKLISLFELTSKKGIEVMIETDWESYNLFKLNKKEIAEFKRYLILKNL